MLYTEDDLVAAVTCSYVKDGVMLCEELEKQIASRRGNWLTVVYKLREMKSRLKRTGKVRTQIIRYRKITTKEGIMKYVHHSHMAFNKRACLEVVSAWLPWFTEDELRFLIQLADHVQTERLGKEPVSKRLLKVLTSGALDEPMSRGRFRIPVMDQGVEEDEAE